MRCQDGLSMSMREDMNSQIVFPFWLCLENQLIKMHGGQLAGCLITAWKNIHWKSICPCLPALRVSKHIKNIILINIHETSWHMPHQHTHTHTGTRSGTTFHNVWTQKREITHVVGLCWLFTELERISTAIISFSLFILWMLTGRCRWVLPLSLAFLFPFWVYWLIEIVTRRWGEGASPPTAFITIKQEMAPSPRLGNEWGTGSLWAPILLGGKSELRGEDSERLPLRRSLLADMWDLRIAASDACWILHQVPLNIEKPRNEDGVLGFRFLHCHFPSGWV